MSSFIKVQEEEIKDELYFSTSRSSGKGGQHVNKTDSRVSLYFNLFSSQCLDKLQKERLNEAWKNRLSKGGVLQIDVEESRSQIRNKKIAIEKFLELLTQSLKKPKLRKATKPSKAAIKKRLDAKKKRSETKQNRRKDKLG